ncbi:MAG: hypothetical protein QXN66_00805 [Thermoplasmatales archaeon]
MLGELLRPFPEEPEREDGVRNIFWDFILASGRFYRSFARFITFKIMNSSMSWYVAYIIVAFVFVLILAAFMY